MTWFCSQSVRVGVAGELVPRVEVKVDIANINDSTVYAILNSVIVDLLQMKIKGCKMLVIEPLLCARRIRDLIYRTFVHSFQV